MPSFRQQPLTWLFFIATACLDAIALATNHEAPWVDAVVLGQIFALGGWLVLGRSHRLARAGVFLAAIGLLTVPDYCVDRRRDGLYADLVWPHVLASIMAIAVVTAACVWCWHLLLRKAFGAPSPPSTRWQFPLAEIFGWMVIVAVAVTGARLADFSLAAEWFGKARETTFAVVLVVAVSAAIALSLGDLAKATWPAGIVESVWLVLILAVAFGSPAVQGNGASAAQPRSPIAALTATVYVGAWVLVRKLDRPPIAAP